ncbi:MAG: hypothetical protein HY862_01905 [Chloroflexi bacterium]|nr:hypothetical protein [Chloroflexota bacterium]
MGVFTQLSFFEEVHAPDFEALSRCLSASTVAIDVETETRWPGQGPQVDYGLSYPAEVGVIALAWLEGDQIETTALSSPFEKPVLEFLERLFTSPHWLVAHNAVFDMRQLSKLTGGQIPLKIWDTQSMARLLHPAVDMRYGLLAVAATLDIPIPENQQLLKGQRGKLHTLPLELTLAYAQADARLALEIYQRQRQLPCDEALVDWECRSVREYCQMAAHGIRLNIPLVKERIQTLSLERNALASRLRDDGLASPGSSKARAHYLYQSKGIPIPAWHPKSPYFTRAGRRRLSANPTASVELTDLSTRSEVIELYLEEDSPYVEQLRDLAAYLEVDWLLSTLHGLLEHAVLDGRLHSLVTSTTESGRRASSYPHMQNWKMPAMAGVAIGDDGFTLVEIDYRNAENVMASMISGDSNLAAACQAEDFHATMALQYFGEAWEQADAIERKRLRNMSKKITYGTAYGMGAERLGANIGVSRNEAMRLMQAKDRAFAKVTQMRNAAQQQVRATQTLYLWTGRPVAVPTPFVAWNYLCQGGVSEMIKRAIVVLAEAYRVRAMRSRVALDMHDALILEVAHTEWTEALNLASEVMSTIAPPELTQHTNPPIRWVAQPNLAENKQKWGAEQWHPM